MVRTRIAPSPTGDPHIGTIYQILFDYAYARKHKGTFIVRTEDTDKEREIEGAADALFKAIDWFGLTEDESIRKEGKYGPYRQSERLNIYQKYAHELVEKGHAYYCFCTKERLDDVRKEMQAKKLPPMYDKHCLGIQNPESRIQGGEKYVIRMKVPKDEKIIVKDGIRGEIEFDSNTIDDQVILKADGFPTYHLAVVVDDHLMEISHAVRGEEWISSMPKHTLLYKYFGWDEPEYFHTPLLRNPDKSKLSKRHGHTSVSWYVENGFLPSAILNFLALMGWSHPSDDEVFSLKEFIQYFDLKDLKAVGPIFDVRKLEWMNGEYIRKTQGSKLKTQIFNFFNGKYSEELIEKTVPLIHERIKTLKEYDDYCSFFLSAPHKYEKDINGNEELFKKIVEALEDIEDNTPAGGWKADHVGEVLQNIAAENNMKFGKFFMLVRIVLTGKKITPPLNESMEILGKEECLKRLRIAM